MAGEVIVHIDSADLYKTGHMANRWFRGLMDQLAFAVSEAAPQRTGDLALGIGSEVNAIPAARRLDGYLTSQAHYTMFVLRGTTGPIMATALWQAGGSYLSAVDDDGAGLRGFWMGVRPAPHSFYGQVTPRWQVAGQRANNFLLRGWRQTSHNHRAMKRIPTFVLHP